MAKLFLLDIKTLRSAGMSITGAAAYDYADIKMAGGYQRLTPVKPRLANEYDNMHSLSVGAMSRFKWAVKSN